MLKWWRKRPTSNLGHTIMGTEGPPITVGLPVYNGETYINTSLDSMLGQTFGDFELVISDNASTDGTEEICRAYASKDRRVRYFRNSENLGANRNFNRIAELARGRYLKWCTADDYWAPRMLERAFDVMENDPTIILCYPKTILCDHDGLPQKPYEDNLHLMQENAADRFIGLNMNIGLCHQHLGLIRRSLLLKTALLLDHFASDLNLLAEMTLYGKWFELPERLFFRRLHPGSSSWERGSVERQTAFTDPQKKYQIRRHRWHRHRAFLIAIRRAPLAQADKWRLYQFVARMMYWERRELMLEIKSGAQAWGRV
jgi:glycosyltransferase involved in cell wall biosynthesis